MNNTLSTIVRIETYRGMDIDEVSNAPINNIYKTDDGKIYHAIKLDFSQQFNYLDIYGSTLERCKASIDFYFKNRYYKYS